MGDMLSISVIYSGVLFADALGDMFEGEDV